MSTRPAANPKPPSDDQARSPDRPLRVLITAGPTYEPIDAVRFIGNRSSGRLGVQLADASAQGGWETRLLLGPSALSPRVSSVSVHRFRTTADLERLLAEHQEWCDVLVMAAAVADYRPITGVAQAQGKLRRVAENLTLELEPTPDLLAACSGRRTQGQTLVGFALEPREAMLESARSKLTRKRVDAIVANPLETMESDFIEAVIVTADGGCIPTPNKMTKVDFAPWLVARIQEVHHAIRATS